MPNTPVQATAEGLPGETEGDGGGRGRRFNLAQIMKTAWGHYRSAKAYVASNPYLRGSIVRFGDCLKAEWKQAKAAAAKASTNVNIQARVAALKAQLLTLDCKSFRYSIATERTAVVTELASLHGEHAR